MYALRPGEYVLKFLKIMRLGIYLVLLTTFTVSANGFSQKVKVTLNLEQRSILEIIKELRKVSDYQFLYRVDELRKCGKKRPEGTGCRSRGSDETIARRYSFDLAFGR
mgnify:FL=1